MEKQMKIAKIISNEAVVINAGRNSGIREGQKFQIIGKKSFQQVIDPDTGESLGTLDELKGIVIARDVYPNMTVAETEKHRAGDSNGVLKAAAESTSNLERLMYGPIIHQKLNVESSQVTGGLTQSTDPVRIGDLVTKI